MADGQRVSSGCLFRPCLPLPKRYAVRLPDPEQRRKILEIMLSDVRLDKSFNLTDIVNRTEGFSGSDLKEACRGAAMQPVREFMRSSEGRKRIQDVSNSRKEGDLDGKAELPTDRVVTRPIRNTDFFVVENVNGTATVAN